MDSGLMQNLGTIIALVGAALAALMAAGIRFLWLVQRIVKPELELTVN